VTGRIFLWGITILGVYFIISDISDAAHYSSEAVIEMRKLRAELHLTVCGECSERLIAAAKVAKDGGLKIVP
jgi:hypothetical protein